MIVCVCRRVSEGDIRREVVDGCSTFEALQDELGVATACGRCSDCARDAFEKARCALSGGSQRAGLARVIPILSVFPGDSGSLAG